MANKITNKEMFTAIANIFSEMEIPGNIETSIQAEDIVTWANDKIAQLNKKSATLSKKEQEKIEADNAIMDEIVAALEDGEAYTITEIIKSRPALDNYSTQKLVPLMRKLVNAGTIINYKGKQNKSFYQINRDDVVARES